MEESILKSIKKLLGMGADYTAFDLDVTLSINSAFSVLNQLGVGPDEAFTIDDEGEHKWSDFKEQSDDPLPKSQMSMVQNYVYLKTRMVFDPPGTSFLLDAMSKQIDELETRLRNLHDATVPSPPKPSEEVWPVW